MKTDKLFVVLLVLGTALIFAMPLIGQQAGAQACDVPLVVTRFQQKTRTVEMVKDLGAKDLTLRVGKSSIVAAGAQVDGGPKRVVVVLDGSSKVPKEEWALETEMATHFVRQARPTDKMALLLVGANKDASELGSPSDVLKSLEGLASVRPEATDSSERTYDTLLRALELLSPPQFGDAVFLFGHPNDFGSKATVEQVEKAFLKRGTRFYGQSFTDPMSEMTMPAKWNPNKPLPATAVQQLPQLLDVSANTGYFFSFQDVRSLSYPGQAELRKNFLSELYAGIAEPYRVTFAAGSLSNPEQFQVEIKDIKKRKINAMDVHYPKMIYPCAVQTRAE